MSDDFTKFTTPRADEELHQGVPVPVVMGISPEDGLPTPITERNFDKAPPLSEDTLICMADKRSFVVRHALTGAVLKAWPPSAVSRLPNGTYVVVAPQFGTPDSDALRECDESKFFNLMLGAIEYLRVEPIRPECDHYLRQQTDLSADREGRYYARACMAQKTEDGEYYSLRDTLVGACSIRAPRHLESEILVLDKFDEEKMSEAQNKRSMEEFDVDKALAEEARNGGLGILGD